MKSFGKHLSVIAAIGLGILVAGQFQVSSGESKPESTTDDSVAGKFVQEPGQRSSLRPAYPRNRPVRLSNTRGNYLMMRAFQEAVGDSWQTSVQVFSGNEQVALGAVVAADGWILTKASQLPAGEISCRLFDQRVLKAELVSELVKHDVALLKVETTNLPTVDWELELPSRGSWLATVDLKRTPRSVGVLSASKQRVRSKAPILGVDLRGSETGAKVNHVLPWTGAEDAGLRDGDSIYEVDGKVVRDLMDFKRAITGAQGGQFIKLSVDRDGSKFSVDARLMDLTDELLDETEMEVNGRVSARATGFEHVFLHDTVLDPTQCGGPIVDLNGRVVGINIARAGRVSSYGLPASVVQPVVQRLIDQAKLVSKQAAEEPAAIR